VVRGNHDRWLLEDQVRGDEPSSDVESISFLARLASHRILMTSAGQVMVCHGFGANDLATVPEHFAKSFLKRARRIGILPETCRAVLYGHSHTRRVQFVEDVLLIGVGNLDEGATGGCAVFDASVRSVSFLRY
jgi:predicted phosphodiesterase